MPDATNVFDYNRYMYVRANPIKFNDPSGHEPCYNGAACGDPSYPPEIQALYDAFQATGPDENYTWEMFYADLLWSTQQAGGNLTTANFAQMPELMETAFNTRHGGSAPEGTAPYVFFLALFRPDDLYAAVAQAENQRVAQLTGVLAALAATNSAIGNGGCSFTAQTLVATAEGAKAIGSIHTGDKVLAWDEETREVGYYTVTDTQAHLDRTLVYLTVDDETILTTPEHPFYVMKSASWLAEGLTMGRWVPAGELAVGDALHQADGSTGVVQAVEVVTQPQVMYNLTVAEVHTFFVGDGQWLVHNQCGPHHYRPLEVDDLPDTYKAPRRGPRQAVVEYGPQRGRRGWLDVNGDVWVPTRPGESHGGPHWDVQIDSGRGGYRNVRVPCPLCAQAE